jgi:hypothetical protein
MMSDDFLFRGDYVLLQDAGLFGGVIQCGSDDRSAIVLDRRFEFGDAVLGRLTDCEIYTRLDGGRCDSWL